MQKPLYSIVAIGLLIVRIGSAQAPSTSVPHRSPVVLTNAASVHNLTSEEAMQGDVITNVAAVRALSPGQAAQGRHVNLCGMVIDIASPPERGMNFRDDTAGLYALVPSDLLSRFHRGDLIKITGTTDPGEFAPIVRVSAATRLGTAPLPQPRPVSYHQLISGVMDAQWVEVSGVVQQHAIDGMGPGVNRTLLAVDGNLVQVRSLGAQDPHVQADAEVQVHALCYYQVNQRRQILTPILLVPRGMSITVEKPVPADPFAAPIYSADRLQQFSPELNSEHRIHVRGVVTYSRADNTVWIRDGTSGLRLQNREPQALQSGDVIDVLGFLKLGGATPILEQCIYRSAGRTNPPVPFALNSPTNAFDHEDDLVSIEAKLTEVSPVVDGIVLTLSANDSVFKGVLKMPAAQVRALDWQPDSRVRVAGICSVNYDDARPVMGLWHPQSFQLLLRSPADLTVLQAPPWWTPGHIILVLALVTGGVLIFSIILALLGRHRLLEQARQRAMSEAQFAAVINERNRLAREIHDTLAQGLAATSVQLQLVEMNSQNDSPPAKKHLEAAQKFVRGSLAEARKSIWNMRPQVLETGNLVTALKNILNQLSDGTGMETHFEVIGRERRLSAMIENNVLRLGQEAITNAVRHAKARHLTMKLDFGVKHFSLTASDDGCGFDPDHPPRSEGGFGLVGMKDRANELGGKFSVLSQPGQGTQIHLHIPLSGG